jgi:hypothetical protein
VVGLHHECNFDDGGEEASDMIEEGCRGDNSSDSVRSPTQGVKCLQG